MTLRPPHRARLAGLPATLRSAGAALAIAGTLLLAGCGQGSAPDLVASAKSYLERNDPRAAIIQLRNAREKAPDDAEVRFLLARALLSIGDATEADGEFRKALEHGYSKDAVIPLLAQSLIAQGQFVRVTKEFGNTRLEDPAARSDLATALSIAWLATGDRKSGGAALASALADNPKNVRALAVRAQVLQRDGDAAGANAALDSALAIAPNDPEATAMKAELLAIAGRRPEAIALLERAVEAEPGALQTRFTLVSQLVAAQQLDKAAALVATMKKDAPRDFRALYSEALVAMARGEAARVRDLTLPLVNARPDHVPSQFLAALANYQLGNYAAALEGFDIIIARVPDDPAPRRLIVASYLRSGRVTQAAEAADQALRRMPNDPVLLRLAGEARILGGNVADAQRFYERAAAAEKAGETTAQLRLAQIRLAAGDTGRALADLERLASIDSARTQADLALFGAHMARREYAKALAATDAIEKKDPGQAQTAELRAMAYAAQRDSKQARAQFEKALQIDPKRLSAARSLAVLDLIEGKVADAKSRYEKVIAADPKSDQALIALAELQALSGGSTAEVKATLDRAIAANPTAAGPRMALIGMYRRNGDLRGALDAARAGVAATPNEAQVVEALGVLQLANGETGQARETFSRLAQLTPQNPVPLLRMAEASIATRDFVSALDAQRKALAMQPDNAQAVVALASTYLMAGRPEDALTEARRQQRERPKAALGFALESEVLAAQKKFGEAAVAMGNALARQPSPVLAARQMALVNAAGKPAEAKALAERWVKEHPKDTAFLLMLGQYRQGSGDLAGSAAAYRAVLELDPDNAVALNNLAWILGEQGRPEARELAERAYRAAPINPSVVDTLGWILARQGDTQRSIELLRQATYLQPAEGRIRIHLAQALAKAGDKTGARRELEAVSGRDSRPAVKAEAEKLLREL